MKLSINSVVSITVKGLFFDLTLAEARELRDKLDELLCPRTPVGDALEQFRNTPAQPQPQPQPQPSWYKTPSPLPTCPIIYCGATETTQKAPENDRLEQIKNPLLRAQ